MADAMAPGAPMARVCGPRPRPRLLRPRRLSVIDLATGGHLLSTKAAGAASSSTARSTITANCAGPRSRRRRLPHTIRHGGPRRRPGARWSGRTVEARRHVRLRLLGRRSGSPDARPRQDRQEALYYHDDGRFLAFSSSLAGLRKAVPHAQEIDPAAVEAYLSLGYVPAPLTILKDSASSRAAECIAFEKGEAKTEIFWSLADERAFRGRFRGGLGPARRAARTSGGPAAASDVPLGVYLSGGIDSSLVAAAAARQTEGRSRPSRSASASAASMKAPMPPPSPGGSARATMLSGGGRPPRPAAQAREPLRRALRRQFGPADVAAGGRGHGAPSPWR